MKEAIWQVALGITRNTETHRHIETHTHTHKHKSLALNDKCGRKHVHTHVFSQQLGGIHAVAPDFEQTGKHTETHAHMFIYKYIYIYIFIYCSKTCKYIFI